MKKLISFLLTFCAAFLAEAQTPFFYQGFINGGAPQTNLIYVTQYPATSGQFTIYGTNIIYGGAALTITPNTGGYQSNALFPGTYRFYITNLNASFIANIPDTTNFLSVALYVTNTPVFSGIRLTSAQLITSLLGYTPATQSLAGISFAQGFTSANAANTNDFARTTADGLSLSISNLTNVKVITNGATVLLSYKTNGVPGSAFTNYPPGSILTTTNGAHFILTNSVWHAISIQ